MKKNVSNSYKTDAQPSYNQPLSHNRKCIGFAGFQRFPQEPWETGMQYCDKLHVLTDAQP